MRKFSNFRNNKINLFYAFQFFLNIESLNLVAVIQTEEL